MRVKPAFAPFASGRHVPFPVSMFRKVHTHLTKCVRPMNNMGSVTHSHETQVRLTRCTGVDNERQRFEEREGAIATST